MILLKELLQEIQTHYRYLCFTSQIYKKCINIGFTTLDDTLRKHLLVMEGTKGWHPPFTVKIVSNSLFVTR